MSLEIGSVIIDNTVQVVSVSEMQELDRKAIEDIGIPSVALMENAGRSVSEVAMDMLGGASRKRIAVFCGTGNNGGDGFVAARHLVKRGIEVNVYLLGERSCVKRDPAINLNILEKMGVEIQELVLKEAKVGPRHKLGVGLIIDAIFGIGLKGWVKEPARSIIAELNKQGIPILSVDVPSGLNADSGEVLGEAIKARRTVTMQFPKKGFYINKGPAYVGEVVVADIGLVSSMAADTKRGGKPCVG